MCRYPRGCTGSPHDAAVETGEFCSELSRGRQLQLLQDRQTVPPGLPGRVVVADRQVRLPQMGEDVRLAGSVAQLAAQLERMLVAGHRLAVIAEVVVGEAETVPGGRLTELVVELLQEVQRLLAPGDGT